MCVCVGEGCLCLSSLQSQWEYSLRSPPAREHVCIWWIAVVSDSLWPHGLQHARLPFPPSTFGSFSNSCPSSWWCHPTISYSVISFSSCSESFPALGSFPVSQFFVSGGQTMAVSASTSVLPMNTQDWSPWVDWLDLLAVQGTFKSLTHHYSTKASILQNSTFFTVQFSHPYPTTGKTIALTRWTFVDKVISLFPRQTIQYHTNPSLCPG